MKKLFFILLTVVAVTSCSKDNTNESRIIGVWASNVSSSINGQQEQTSRDEWKFLSDNTGTYKEFYNGDLTLEVAFSWSQDGDRFYVEYAERKSNEYFTIGNMLGETVLLDFEGYMIAIKE